MTVSRRSSENAAPHRNPRRSGRLVLAALGIIVFSATRSHAETMSTYGSYTILAGVDEAEAQAVHESMILSGLTPLYVDAYRHPNGTAYYVYSSIWMKADGVKREIFLDWTPWQVTSRLESSETLNELLQVDAWTLNHGLLPYGPDYYPEYYFETHVCGVFTEEDLPERAFVYAPLAQLEDNLYWPPEWPTINEAHEELSDQGFEMLSAAVVRPDIPEKTPNDVLTQAPVYGPYAWERNAIVALFEKSDSPTSSRWEMSFPEAEDYVSDQMASGWEPIYADIYQHKPWDGYLSHDWLDPDERPWRLNYGVIVRKDPRYHWIEWERTEDEIDEVHQLAYFYGLRPLAITGSLSPDSYGAVVYTIVVREITVRRNPDLDPSDDDLKPMPGRDDDGGH